MVAPMRGIRVVEVASWTYVPIAGALLAEWGADVIKVENPDGGDPQRGLITSAHVERQGTVANPVVEIPNRGKRSIALDLKSEEGYALLLRLVGSADVFLTNVLADQRRALRIDVDDLRAVNPKLVYARGSGKGERGPEAKSGGFDGATFWARNVADSATPAGEEYPVGMPSGAFADTMGGLTIAGGIAAALLHRQVTGEPSVVENSLLSLATWAMQMQMLSAAAGGVDRVPKRERERNSNPLVNYYRTADGRFIYLCILQADRYWPELVELFGRPELAEDPRWVNRDRGGGGAPEIVALLDEIFATRTYDEWRKVLSALSRGAVWEPVQSVGEVLTDEQVRANGYIREAEMTDGKPFPLVGSPLQYDQETPPLVRAPELSEHAEAILAELGLGADEIRDARVRGAVL